MRREEDEKRYTTEGGQSNQSEQREGESEREVSYHIRKIQWGTPTTMPDRRRNFENSVDLFSAVAVPIFRLRTSDLYDILANHRWDKN